MRAPSACASERLDDELDDRVVDIVGEASMS